MVIWITGISGSGKTTICDTIWRLAKPHIPELVNLDGDVVRDIFNDKLGYEEPDRVRQIRRIQRLAKMLDAQGMIVLVAALYAHTDLLTWNRENFADYAEIYLDAPLALVQDRDPKGLYEMARSGEMKNVVGIDIPWHAPEAPTLRVEMTPSLTPEGAARQVLDAIPALSDRLPSVATHA